MANNGVIDLAESTSASDSEHDTADAMAPPYRSGPSALGPGVQASRSYADAVQSALALAASLPDLNAGKATPTTAMRATCKHATVSRTRPSTKLLAAKRRAPAAAGGHLGSTSQLRTARRSTSRSEDEGAITRRQGEIAPSPVVLKKRSLAEKTKPWVKAAERAGVRREGSADYLPRRPLNAHKPQSRMVNLLSSSSSEADSDSNSELSASSSSESGSPSRLRRLELNATRSKKRQRLLTPATQTKRDRPSSDKRAGLAQRVRHRLKERTPHDKRPARHSHAYTPSSDDDIELSNVSRTPAAVKKPLRVERKLLKKPMAKSVPTGSRQTSVSAGSATPVVLSALESNPRTGVSAGVARSTGPSVANKKVLFYCKKSAPVTVPIPARPPHSPLSAESSDRSISSPSSPEVEILATRKPRALSSRPVFRTDNIALEEIQAQERELAHIQAQMKRNNRTHTPTRTRQPKRESKKVIEIDDHSDVESEVEHHPSPVKKQAVRTSHGSKDIPQGLTAVRVEDIGVELVAHPTAFRSRYLVDEPLNLLRTSELSGTNISLLEGDPTLVHFDVSRALVDLCRFLPTFGEPKQFISPMYSNEPLIDQAEVDASVRNLVDEHLPSLRRCQQMKAQSIIGAFRTRTALYVGALDAHRQKWQDGKASAQRYFTSLAETKVVQRARRGVPTISGSRIDYEYEIGRAALLAKPLRVVRQAFQLPKLQSLSKSTVSIGTKSSVRVDDDPILRHASLIERGYAVDHVTTTASEEKTVSRGYGLQVASVVDEEVVEYVIRLVVSQVGDSDQVFHAMKTQLGIAQGYTQYVEFKKRHDRRCAASARRKELRELVQDRGYPYGTEVLSLLRSMRSCSLSDGALKRKRRDHAIESNFLANWTNSAGGQTENRVLGLRVSGDYAELSERLLDSFCRQCFTYDCREHGTQYPLPLRRVDPVFPSCQPSRYSRRKATRHLLSSVWLNAVGADGKKALGSRRKADPNMTGAPSTQDPSEYLDFSHLAMVGKRMEAIVDGAGVCGDECWKSKGEAEQELDEEQPSLGVSDVAVINKLRTVIGDSACLLAAVVGGVSCMAVHKYLTSDRGVSGVTEDDSARSGRRTRLRGRVSSGGGHHELFQRTRNQRLRDRGCANHEYKPCSHEGPCNSMGCSCMTRDHMCEKACACPRDCPNRFEGCSCAPGTCHSSDSCPCVAALRECDPDRCVSCGAGEMAVDAAVGGMAPTARSGGTCCNVSVQRGLHKHIRMSFSVIHGWGVYAAETIGCGEFVYEYTGALLSQDEAERRGLVYDRGERSYLFDLNEDAVVDAIRNGNKSKFINHAPAPGQNCRAKVVNVGGVHHIGIWAERRIECGEELVFDYGYSGYAAPVWSQRRVAS